MPLAKPPVRERLQSGVGLLLVGASFVVWLGCVIAVLSYLALVALIAYAFLCGREAFSALFSRLRLLAASRRSETENRPTVPEREVRHWGYNERNMRMAVSDDLLIGRDLLRARLDVFDDGADRNVDAALQIHRVHARIVSTNPAMRRHDSS